MAEIVLATAVKPFGDAEIARLQLNALRSWRALGDEVEVLVVGDEPGAREAARQVGVGWAPHVERNAAGTPLVRSVFDAARAISTAPLVAYANADILLLDDFLPTASRVATHLPAFVIVAQRWDVRVAEEIAVAEGWTSALRRRVEAEGRLHPPAGSDVFVFPRDCYRDLPALAIGRAGWDNWMIYEARRRRWPVVDATRSMTVVHQEHDYRHLPGGASHHRHPESDENVRLAGGRRTILTLVDADWALGSEGLRRKGMIWRRLLREAELLPVLRTRSWLLANAAFAVFHPLQAARRVAGWLRWKTGSQAPVLGEELPR